jgi:large subunit ribosomal protein L27e
MSSKEASSGKKLLKAGKVVIVTAGRYAGRKAIIVKTFEEGASRAPPPAQARARVWTDPAAGAKERKYGHCLVAGIDRHPKKVTKAMSAKKIKSRSAIKPFARFVNFNHILPTRYQVDLDVKKLTLTDKEGKAGEALELSEKVLVDAAQRKIALGALKGVFEQGYEQFDAKKEGKGKVGEGYLYKRLRF